MAGGLPARGPNAPAGPAARAENALVDHMCQRVVDRFRRWMIWMRLFELCFELSRDTVTDTAGHLTEENRKKKILTQSLLLNLTVDMSSPDVLQPTRRTASETDAGDPQSIMTRLRTLSFSRSRSKSDETENKKPEAKSPQLVRRNSGNQR